MQTRFWSENLTGRDHSEDLGIDGNIILERKESMGKFGLDSTGSGQGPVTGSF